MVAHAPSVQMQDVPPDLLSFDKYDEMTDADIRESQEELERRLVRKYLIARSQTR